MRRYNVLQALVLAFYSKAFYQDVARNWRGIGLRYLLMLSMISSLPFCYYVYQNMDRWIKISAPLVEQIPTVTIQQGEASITQPEPFYIKWTDNGQIFAVIDTTGGITSFDNTTENTATARILLTKNKLFTRQAGMVKEFDLTKTKDAVYTADTVRRFLVNLSYWMTAITLPFVTIMYFLFGLIAILLYAALTKLFISTGLNYKATCRLAATAFTPAYLIAMLLTILSIQMPYRWVIFVPLSIGYLIYAIRATWNADEKNIGKAAE